MSFKTKILIVEHDENDIELLHYELRKGGINYSYQIVQTEFDYCEALKKFVPDLILSDFTLPSFDGATAYELKEKLASHTPFIFVTGAIREENAVEYVKNGITEYALKDKLYSLIPKIQRALADVKARQQKNKTELELAQSERQLARAQQIAHMGSWEMDLDSDIIIWSDESCRIFGVPLEENYQSQRSFLSFVHPNHIDFVSKMIKDSFNLFNDLSYNYCIIRKDGVLRYLHTESKFAFDENGKATTLFGITHDVTEITELEQERKKNEKAIIESEARLKKAESIAHIGNWELDFSDNILSLSDEGARIFGFAPNENQLSYETWASLVHPDDLQTVLGLITESQVSLTDTTYTHRIVLKDGSIRDILSESKFKFNEEGKATGMFGINQDVTERKAAERKIRELNEGLELRVVERTAELSKANAALEAFSYSVSHDLRAPVRAIMGFTKLIQKDYGHTMDPREKELLGFIGDGSKRMSSIIDDLLKFAKYGTEKLEFTSVDMSQLIKAVWLNICDSNPHKAKLELEELPKITVDRSMIEQVIINLISNAVKYSSKKEQPVIKISCHKAKMLNTFYIKDNGAGFDMKNYDRLFGAFQRLHSTTEFEGNGVGLMLVKSIIEKHGGTVGAESKVNEGATFHFTVPV